MVDYPTFFGIVQSVANDKGATQAQHQSLASEAGAFWRANKATVRGWTRTEARQWARQNVVV